MTSNEAQVTLEEQLLDAGFTPSELAPHEWILSASTISESKIEKRNTYLEHKITSHRMMYDQSVKRNVVLIDHQYHELHSKLSNQYRVIPHGMILDKAVAVANASGTPIQSINLDKS